MAADEQQVQKAAQAGCSLVFGIIVIGVAFFVGGIFRTPVEMSFPGAGDSGDSIRFEEQFTARHWLIGIIQGKQPDVSTALARYFGEGDRLGEMTVVTRHTAVDMLIMGVTLSIYCPKTVTVRGTIYKAAPEAAPPPAEPAPTPE